MGKTQRIGLVGCGFFARNHLFSWKDLEAEGAELVAVCDTDPEKARAAADEFGVPRVYTDMADMLADGDVDLIDIVTRMETHRALVEQTMAAGVPTVVQKPFAPDWADAVAMTRASEEAGIFLAVHENFRFQIPMMKLQETLKSGVIGDPNWARLSWRTGYDVYSGQPYFYDVERFIILDLVIHVLDLARYFLGEVKHVACEAQGRNPKVTGEDTATLMMRHESGAVSVVDCSYESRRDPDAFPQTVLEIEGPDGTIFIDPDSTMRVTRRGESKTTQIGSPLLHWTSEPWHTAQESVLITCRHMLNRVREGRPADTSAIDNLKTFALVEAAYQSAETGQTVRPLTDPD